MFRLKKNLSIRYKIFLAVCGISIVPLIVFAAISTGITYSTMRAQLISSRTSNMDWIADKLFSNVRYHMYQFYEYEVNKDLKNAITNWVKNGYMDYVDISKLRTEFETTLSIDTSVKSIEVYSLSTGDGFISTRASFRAAEIKLDEKTWANRNSKGLQTNIVFEADGDDMLVMHRMNDFSTGKGIAIFVLRIRMQVYIDMLEKLKTDYRETAVLINDDNKVLLSVGDEYGGFDESGLNEIFPQLEKNTHAGFQSKNNLIFFDSVLNGKLKAVCVVPNKIILQSIWRTVSIGLIIMISAVIAAVILSILISRFVSRPIIQLSEKMRTYNISETFIFDEIKREDEIGYLENSFNIMVKRNQELIANELEINRKKRDAQIKALQAQINPHFIYNTLQIVGSMALNNQIDDIYPVVVTISDIMRYSFNFSQEMVPIKREVDYLKGYLSIQNRRFNNRISFEIHIPDDVMDTYIPRLILQPILENSFVHGLLEWTGDWKICVKAVKEDEENLVIVVADNGVGISKERLSEINEELAANELNAVDAQSHIGLSNVNTRLRLRYGEAYGVKACSEAGKGTVIKIRLKLNRGGGE
ncbi:MAG: sensor histidine kinase [Clostridiales bacterium]|jgi:sensor histidine kinase YesM|nr:sensor histidine kinase [Clostridiales bacterium]